MGKDGSRREETNLNLSLFESKAARGRNIYKLFASTVFVGICLIWIYRLINMPRRGESGRWAWIGMFLSELVFGFYWIITQSARLDVIYRFPFKNRLSLRFALLSFHTERIFFSRYSDFDFRIMYFGSRFIVFSLLKKI